MPDIYFRGDSSHPAVAAPKTESIPETPKDNRTPVQEVEGEPLSGERADAAVLLAFGIEDNLKNLPDEARDNLTEIRKFLDENMRRRGITPTKEKYKNILEELKIDLEIDPQADVDFVIDKIAGLIKSYKALIFIKNPQEKRSLFMKLARQPTSRQMDEIIFEEMNKHQVWR